MTSDLGLDLDAIEAASGGHSIFAPSGSAIWLNTPGCLIPNLLAPDSAGIDAAYGTVGHEIGEQWLLAIPEIAWGMGALAQRQIDEAEPVHRLGEIVIVKERKESFEIEIDQEMLDHVRKYVEWCIALPGEHYVEQRVYFSDLTPIDNQGGTSDHAACLPGVLTISDLKMGFIIVLAAWNSQLMLYAYGFFREWDWKYNFQRIVIRIAQPRRDHFDVWECSREELLAFAEYVKGQAKKAWVLDGPRKPGWWCKKAFCNVQGSCPAYINYLEELADADGDVFDDDGTCQVCEGLGCDACGPASEALIEGEYTVKDMAVAAEMFVSGKMDLTPRRQPHRLDTEALAKLLPMRSVVERFFNEVERELESRAIDGEEIPGFKLVEGRNGRRSWRDEKSVLAALAEEGVDSLALQKVVLLSPAEASKAVRKALGCTVKEADAVLDSLVSRPPRRQTLVEIADKRAPLDPIADDVFSDTTGL